MGLAASKWHNWKHRYGKANEHNAWVPRDHWLEPAEKQAILDFHDRFPLEGYRRLTFMMIDADSAVCSPRERLPRPQGRRPAGEAQPQALLQGPGVRPAPGPAPALARGHLPPQHRRHLLLPVQHPGRLQP